MPSEPLHSAFDALRARLQAELEAQLASLEHTVDARHQDALAEATRTAAAAAEQQWTARLDALRDEWSTRLRDELAAAAATSERTLASEISRLETEKAAAIAAVQQRADPVDPSPGLLTRLADTLPAIARASSLSAALDALAAAAVAAAPEAALFLVSRPDGAVDVRLEPWRGGGSGRAGLPDPGLVAEAVQTRQPSAFGAARAGGRLRLVVPLVVGGDTVAILHVQGDAPAAWPDAMRILGAHTSACLAQLTAIRISQALGAGRTTPPTTRDDDGSARRYARLLVSEIKLYNESAVRTGRERRDLLARLRPEIDRARRLYEERVPTSLGDRASVFQQELIQTLAEGDPALLGASA
jgi:hypothetical protein